MPHPHRFASKERQTFLARIDRRRLLALVGLGSVGATVRSHGPLRSRSAQPGTGTAAQAARAWAQSLESAELGGWLGFQQQVGAFLARAIHDAPVMLGRGDLLAERWDEAHTLWSAASRLVGESELGLGLLVEPTRPDGLAAAIPLGLPAVPTELPRFLEDERSILRDWQRVSSEGWASFDASVEDTGRKVLAKLLAAAGIKEAAQAVLGILDESGYLWLIGQAIDLRDGRMLLRLLTEILDFMLGRRFLQRLANEVGEREARRLIGRLAGRFLPYVGWGLFLAQLLWAFAEQADVGWLRDALGETLP